MKDVKNFLPRVNCKIPLDQLRDLFNEVDTLKEHELGFDEFSTLFQRLTFDSKVSRAESFPMRATVIFLYMFCLCYTYSVFSYSMTPLSKNFLI